MKNWNELSITDKNDIIKVAVQNGITTLPEIRERYNEFAEGGEEETIEKVLPEVVVKPSEEDKNSLAKMIRMLPDAKSREDMYYEIDPWNVNEPLRISQNESIDRLYNVYKLSGYPDVSSHRTILNYFEYPFSKWLDRPMYNPITNTMHLPNSEETKYDAAGFIPELAHAYQFHGDKTGFLDFLKSAFHLPGDIKINGKSGYERPGHMEHTAHSVIEPAIYDYVQGYTDSFNPSSYASGGKIHIKEKNRGKFTALKKRTGHSASWFKAHGTPAQRKMATFALNARKWKHGDGGHLYDGESEDTQQMYTGFDWWNRAPMTDYVDIAYEPIPDNAPKSKGTPLLDTPIMVQTTPTASTAATFGQYMPKYESTPKRELITLGATVAAPFLPSIGQFGLQAMNTAFTPSTWLNPVTGAKLLSPTVGTVADAGIQGAFAYEGLNGLWNQGREGTLLSDPASTLMHGLEVIPLASPAVKVANEVVEFAKSPGRYVFNNLPYKTIDKLPSVGRIRETLKTPTRNIFSPSFSDKRVLAADRPLNISSEQTYNTYRGGDLDTFMARMASHPDLNPDDVRVVDYLSLPDIYRFNKWVDNHYSRLFKRRSNPFSLLLRTPRDYIKLNMEPAFAGPGFVKMNVPHMKALNLSVDAALPHELAHIYRRRDILDTPLYYEGAFFPEILPKGLDSYLTGDELWARGTQLKNYFGITDNSPITADMLKYAAKNYVKDTGQNNNMNQFFHTIMNSTSKMSPEQKKRYKDGWEMAADYISKYSYSDGGPLVEMAMGGRLNGK